jgi:hypothetical protein
MREDGTGVSNERASLLLKILKAEQELTTIGLASGRSHPEDVDPLSDWELVWSPHRVHT